MAKFAVLSSDIEISGAIWSESEAWVDSIDRSELGAFAVPRVGLVAINATEQSHTDAPYGVALATYSKINDAFASAGITRHENHLYAAEMLYWRGSLDDKEYRVAYGGALERLAELHIIATRPVSMHPYFAVGIWDTGFIERCISDGIDPALASEVRL